MLNLGKREYKGLVAMLLFVLGVTTAISITFVIVADITTLEA